LLKKFVGILNTVFEGQHEFIIFDPKYRVAANIGKALGEMHKYRDGILVRKDNTKAVREVYIVTPGEDTENLRYYQSSFHKTYGMGAIQLTPRAEQHDLMGWFKKWKCTDNLELNG
jgi:hypothetical protein